MEPPMANSKHKMTVYVPDNVFDEMRLEAERQERSVSWLVEHAWKLSRGQVKTYPTVAD